MTCVHQQQGLCRECQDWYERDRTDYLLYGDHLEGLKRREAKKKDKERPDQVERTLPTAPKLDRK